MRAFWIVLLTVLLGASAPAEQAPLNGVVAIVNDALVTRWDVVMLIGRHLDLLDQQFGSQPQVLRQKQAELWQDGIEQLVERQLIMHDFKTAGYNMPETIIDDHIRERIKKRFGDRVTLTKTLKADGVSFETFRRHQREEIIVEQLRYFHVSKEIIISPQKIADYYEANKTNYAVADQVRLRTIVLNQPPGGDMARVRQLAQEILGKINEGASFEEMARIHSEGPKRADGGDSGFIERSVLRKELAEAASRLQKGQRSGVVELSDSCCLMLMEDTHPARIKPLTELRDEIERELAIKERARLEKKWIDRLKAKSFIRYF